MGKKIGALLARQLSPGEERVLAEDQKAYLRRHKHIVSLQPDCHASDALYLTLRHGAVTISRAMELDAAHDCASGDLASIAAAHRAFIPLGVSDEWERRDLACSDQNGFSSLLW